jgi:hypothetical protein
VVAAVVAVLAATMVVAQREQEQWAHFSAAHQCKVVGKMTGSVISTISTTIGAKGQVLPTVGTAVEPDKTGYLCDDGITYWRN